MRLINTTTKCLEDVGSKKCKYAVLSHCWTDEEVSFLDISAKGIRKEPMFAKIENTLKRAKHDGYEYAWIDTCCIDKRSSSELDEAINSMFNWYRDAEICYAYLHDVTKEDGIESFRKSKWFTRGWTLQELLAPTKVLFYDQFWHYIGDKASLEYKIAEVTSINILALKPGNTRFYSIAQKMSWAASRVTTRPEDRAYSLMGLFDVNMPTIYGEGGEKAFIRLQEEIVKDRDDHSIFAWEMGKSDCSGLLAPSPANFVNCGDIVSCTYSLDRSPFSKSNRGMNIKLKITPWWMDTYLAYLECSKLDYSLISRTKVRVGVFLRRLNENDQYARIKCQGQAVFFDRKNTYLDDNRPMLERQLFVRQNRNWVIDDQFLTDRRYGFKINKHFLPHRFKIFPRESVAPQDDVFGIKPASWGVVAIIDVSQSCLDIQQITLGFDFDFNPVCLLEGPRNPRHDTRTKQVLFHDFETDFSGDYNWCEIHEGSRVYQPANYDGIWALKGHRKHGLDVMLSKALGANGPIVKIQRGEMAGSLIWQFSVEHLEVPFVKRNYVFR